MACELHAFDCHLIDLRRGEKLLSKTAEVTVTEVIDENVNQIGFVRSLKCPSAEDAGDEDDESHGENKGKKVNERSRVDGVLLV